MVKPNADPAPGTSKATEEPQLAQPETPSRKRRHPQSELVEYFKSRDKASDSELELRKKMLEEEVRLKEKEVLLKEKEIEVRKLETENAKEIEMKKLAVREMEAQNQKDFQMQILQLLAKK